MTIGELNDALVKDQYDGLARNKWTDWRDGWKLFWTGFKVHWNNAGLYGQWLAVRPGRGVSYYSATPGSVGQYRAGDQFDVVARPGQVYVTLDKLAELGFNAQLKLARHARDQAFVKLVAYMEADGEFAAPAATTQPKITVTYHKDRLLAPESAEAIDKLYRSVTQPFSAAEQKQIFEFKGWQPTKYVDLVQANERLMGGVVAHGQPVDGISVPLETLVGYKCLTCGARDLDDRDIQPNPRKDGEIYGCWHCSGRKLEKL